MNANVVNTHTHIIYMSCTDGISYRAADVICIN